MENLLIYILYFTVSTLLTIFVGNLLHSNGRIWIIGLLNDLSLSDKVNNLLLLLYRLVNIGYILLTLMSSRLKGQEPFQIIEFLSVKFAIILLILAYLHYQNIFMLMIFSKLKSKYKWQI